MRIRVKLMGVLKEKTPAGGVLELQEGATVEEALQALGVEASRVQMCTVNGQFARDRTRALSPDDELSVLPPVGGG